MADRPEARIPCPQCGGAIHPVAGKCKHCKANLAALRVGKPQAATTLPTLATAPTAAAPVPPPPLTEHEVWSRPPDRPAAPAAYVSSTAYTGSSPMRAIDHASAQFGPVGHDDSGPAQILPPRPTGRMFAVAPTPKWPLVVIAVSVLAILLSIGALAR